MPPQFRIAGWLWGALLRYFGIVAITMPWRRVYILPEWTWNSALHRHEMVHLRQIDRDGSILFSVRYLYWLARYGYRANPYEIEAYSEGRVSIAEVLSLKGE